MSEDRDSVRPFQIPDEHAEALTALARMDDDEFDTLKGVLVATTAKINRWEIVHEWCDQLAVDFDLAAALMESIGELSGVCHSSGSSAADVAERVRVSTPFDELESDVQELLIERVRSILECPDIRIFGKAMEISTLHQQMFGAAEIYTDLRPVFGDKESDDLKIESGLLTHVLRLHHITSDGTHQDFYVAMREEHLFNLRMAMDRAEEKARLLRRWLDEAGMRLVTPEYE